MSIINIQLNIKNNIETLQQYYNQQIQDIIKKQADIYLQYLQNQISEKIFKKQNAEYNNQIILLNLKWIIMFIAKYKKIAIPISIILVDLHILLSTGKFIIISKIYKRIKSILISFLNRPSLTPFFKLSTVDFVMNSNCFC